MPLTNGYSPNVLLTQRLSTQDTDILMTTDAGCEVGMDSMFGQGGVVTYFDALSEGRDPKVFVNWIVQAFFGQLAARSQTLTKNPSWLLKWVF